MFILLARPFPGIRHSGLHQFSAPLLEPSITPRPNRNGTEAGRAADCERLREGFLYALGLSEIRCDEVSLAPWYGVASDARVRQVSTVGNALDPQVRFGEDCTCKPSRDRDSLAR